MAHIVRLMSFMLVLFVLLAGGCTITRAPELRVQEATWGEASDDAQRLDIEVMLRNPTPPREETATSSGGGGGGAVRVLEIHYEVHLDGRAVYRGRWDARATLAAATERSFTLPAVVKKEGSIDPTSLRVSGQVWYLPDDQLSAILADLGLRHRRTRFAGEGRVE